MAITIDDFNKIWASTSPLTPYEFSESNYKQGWNFVGGTPPSRQMWDFLQKNNDEKMKYLADNYLPLSGGTLTGDVNGITPTQGDNTKKLATTAYVQGEISVVNNDISAINTRLGTILEASGTATTVSTITTVCSIATHPAGVFLITSFMALNYNGTSVYINTIKTANHGSISTRNTSIGGGGNCAVLLTALDENETVELNGYQDQAGTMSGNLKMVRLA